MNWIAGYVLLSIAVCLLTVAAHDVGAWLAKTPIAAWSVTMHYTLTPPTAAKENEK